MKINVKYTAPDEIARLRELCLIYELEDAERLEKYSNTTLASSIYNGAGPDSWNPEARDLLTNFMKLFEPVVLIHDTQFYESDGKHKTFQKTVELWERNCRRIFDAEYPLITYRMLSRDYRVKRAYWYGVLRAGILCISGTPAFHAWKEAFAKRVGLAN